VLRAAEGRLEPVDCVKSTACPVKDSCGSRHTWEELSAAINGCVDSLTLADLARAYHNMDMVEYSI
jgi:DNA-binding IscR family transcriptional regulator